MKRTINFLFLGLSTLGILGGFFKIYHWHQDNLKVADLNKKLEENTVINLKKTNEVLFNPPLNKEDSSWSYQDVSFLEVDFQNLSQENSDVVAYLEVLGTNISYPVVQSDDNSYYLTHSFDKKENSAGWIFLDYRNNIEKINYNTIIYGHGRGNKIMFNGLRDVLESKWLKIVDNHLIKMSTKKMNMVWQVFSVYTIYNENYYLKTIFETKKNYQIFLDTLKNRSIYDFKTTLNEKDRILTLSTCYNSVGVRLVLHAKLLKKETRL